MRKLILLILIINSSNLFAQAQPIKSLSLGNKWFYSSSGGGHPIDHYVVTYRLNAIADTLIDQTKFIKIEHLYTSASGATLPTDPYYYFERSDSIRGEVIFNPNIFGNVNFVREVMYDFSMQIGETYYNTQFPYMYSQPYFTIIAKGDMTIFGESLRFIKIKAYSFFYASLGTATVIITEKFGMIWIDCRGNDFRYISELKGAFIDGITFGDTTTTSVKDKTVERMNDYCLFQNYPNPFNSSTEIRYSLPQGKSTYQVSLKIYDIRGRLVNTLVDQNQAAGTYSVRWNGSDMNGQSISSGMYFFTLQIDKFKATNKLLLIR